MKYLIDKEVLNNRLAFFTVPTDIWEAIQHTPIVDAYYQCSECGTEFALIDGTPSDNDYLYCPHCGAKMDGKDGGGNG